MPADALLGDLLSDAILVLSLVAVLLAAAAAVLAVKLAPEDGEDEDDIRADLAAAVAAAGGPPPGTAARGRRNAAGPSYDLDDDLVSIIGPTTESNAEQRFRRAFAMMAPSRREQLIAHRMRKLRTDDRTEAMLDLLHQLERRG
jgi:hypothetical protein